MTIVNLYRYQRADGGYTVSPVKPEDGIEYIQRYRLVADDDKAITNGTIITSCVDVDSPDGWVDTEQPEESHLPDYKGSD